MFNFNSLQRYGFIDKLANFFVLKIGFVMLL